MDFGSIFLKFMSNTVQSAVFLGLVAVLSGVVAVAFSYEEFAGLMIVGPVVVVLGIALIPKLLPYRDRRFLLKLAILGFIAKMIGSLARLTITDQVWGFADAGRYNIVGIRISDALRAGNLSTAFTHVEREFAVGTQNIEAFTGIVYTIFGQSLYGGFLLFAFAAFIGALLFVKAYEETFGEHNLRLFAVLMMFYPSLLLWPSSLGKDSILFFFAGLATYGVTKLTSRMSMGGLVLLFTGLAGTAMIRPHAAVIYFMALGAATLLRNPGKAFSNHVKYVIVASMFALIILVGYARAGQYLDLSSVSLEAVLQVLSEEASSDYGASGSGSNFSVTPVGDLLWLPMGVVTVLFRPFPWDASSLLMLIQSGESLLLAGLVLWKWKTIVKNISYAGRNPLLVYALGVIFLNVVALSTIGNFGLLSRQRAVLFPFLFILISVQWAADRRIDQSRLNQLQAVVI